jgi:hypothetical protein
MVDLMCQRFNIKENNILIFYFLFLDFKKNSDSKARSVGRRLIKCPKKKNVEPERKHPNMWWWTHGYLTT